MPNIGQKGAQGKGIRGTKTRNQRYRLLLNAGLSALSGGSSGLNCGGGGPVVSYTQPVTFVAHAGINFDKYDSTSGEKSLDVGFDNGCGLPSVGWACAGAASMTASKLTIEGNAGFGNAITQDWTALGLVGNDWIQVTLDIESITAGTVLEFYSSDNSKKVVFETAGVITKTVQLEAAQTQVSLYNVTNGSTAIINSLSIKKLSNFERATGFPFTATESSPTQVLSYLGVTWAISPVSGQIIEFSYDAEVGGTYVDSDNVPMLSQRLLLTNCSPAPFLSGEAGADLQKEGALYGSF